jgi:hypothetical protein
MMDYAFVTLTAEASGEYREGSWNDGASFMTNVSARIVFLELFPFRYDESDFNFRCFRRGWSDKAV